MEENLFRLTIDDREIYLLGTAHVLEKSKEEVEKYINELDPDTVCVELCEARYNSLKDENRWQNLDIVKVIKEGKAFLLLANMILSSFQKRIGKNLKTKPGVEMLEAIKLAEEKSKRIVLVDRDVNLTLKRAWALSNFSDKMKILEVLFESIFSNEKVEKEEIENLLENGDLISSMMDELSTKLPKVKEVLIDERDYYIANKIFNSEGKKILAVVGKGHINGIIKFLEKKEFKTPPEEFESIPEGKKLSKLTPYIFGLIIAVLFVLGFMKGTKVGIDMLYAWIIASGITTSLAALMVMAHPVTIILSWLAAPIKLILPPISAGIFLAPIEAVLRKPRVIDFENLNEDLTTFRGFIKNRVTKILLVFAAVTIGAIVGHTIAIVWMTKILAS
ncbi:MAG: TraB/GumN family protein [Brevinematales bacterium]|nr:TraB/GumN family protein [Brevinematales bacterium]